MVVTVDAYKIAYMPMPKAACSSVKTALAWIDGAVDVKEVDMKTAHRKFQTRRFRMDRWEVFGPDWFKFCVIRDPLERLLSCYTDIVLTRGELTHSRRLRAMRPKLPTLPDPDFFFQNLGHYRRVSSSVKHHSFHASMFLGDDLGHYDAVFRTSELSDLERALGQRAGMAFRLPRANATKRRLVLGDLAPQTRQCIADWLAPDYALLADFYPSPFVPQQTSISPNEKVA